MSTSRRALLLVPLLLWACQSRPEQPDAGHTETPGGLPDSPADTSTGLRPSAPAADRTPETDPWLFEGIPNFEDLVSAREGDWLVVLGATERDGGPASETIMRAEDAGLAAVQQRAWDAGAVPFLVASETLPSFEPGLTVLVLGPFPRPDAERLLAEMRAVVPDAYLKAGW